MDNSAEAADFSEAMLLEQVKGRGNSSWEASSKIFGKYAFNMKLAARQIYSYGRFGIKRSKELVLARK